MSNKSRYSLRSCASDMGTISSRTRSSGVKISEVDIALPVRKRAIRVKTEPSGVVIKVEQPADVEESVETTTIPEPLLQVKREPEASTSTSNVIAVPPSPASSSRSSSPIFLKAEPRASPPSTTISSSSSSLSSTLSLSSASSSCSSFHLSSSSPPPSRQRDDGMDSWSNPTSINNAPSGSTAKVWDMQNGQLVIRELPLVQTAEQPRYEQERSVSTFNRGRPYRKPFYRKPYYKKPYYKKPYKPYWKWNNRGDGAGTRWDCRCSGNTCSNCGAVTTYQSNNKPMNIHCNISINAPSTYQSSSVYIEELPDEENSSSINYPSTHQSSSVYIEELPDEENSSSSHKKFKASNAVALPEPASFYYLLSTPVVIPVPVPVVVPQPVYYYQSNAHISYSSSYSYMEYNVSCSTRFY